MRGFDIGDFLPEKFVTAHHSGCGLFRLMVEHVAATPPHEQRQLLYSGNRALVLTNPNSLASATRVWAIAPYLQDFLNARVIVRLNRSLPATPACDPVLLILRKVTLKFISLQIPVVNATNSCALQHRRNCDNDFSNSIQYRL
jgi:hypothetical protein